MEKQQAIGTDREKGAAPVIELLGVCKSFGEQKVLLGIDLRVYSGKTLVVVGASGQGKSIILKHMLGLIRPDRGVVKVFGRDLNRLRRSELGEIRQNFGVLFQNAALLDSLNVFDNVALPLRERTRQTEADIRANVMEKLAMMALEDATTRFPAQLSGGMRKRVGLARALVLRPKILFFDEPTTGLDVSKSNDLYRLFYRLQKHFGYTAVIVSHDVPKIFKLADQVALLANGVIQGCMSPEQFQTSQQPQIQEFVAEALGDLSVSAAEEGDFYAQVQP